MKTIRQLQFPIKCGVHPFRFLPAAALLSLTMRFGSAVVSMLLVGFPTCLYAYTFPVDHQGGPRATATYVEDHAGWHAGIDLPRTDGASVVRATGDETVFHVYTLAFDNVRVVNGDNPSKTGPWSFELQNANQKYMLDILKVRRVTPGKPVIEYHVRRVVETQPGIALDGVELVPDFPSPGDSLTAGDQFEVDYAYYSSRIFQTAHLSTVGGEYRYYAHIDSVHKYVAWNTYPATAENRYYGTDTGVPSGRAAHVVNEGQQFAEIETIYDFASEPHHLHFGLSSLFMFPVSTTNPLSNIVFPTDDPQGNRPSVRSLALLYGNNEYVFPDPKLYGRVNILVESRDDMGSPEAGDDGDGAENTIREAGCYNAGYWVTAESADGEDVASGAQPNTMFAGYGKDTITGNDPLPVILMPTAPYRVDINTNYHLVVSHVEEDSSRFWNTRARAGFTLNDGSDAPQARVNSEARFGDGRYTIHTKARDVVTYGAERDSMVVVDNFRPYVRKVIVRDDSGELYSGEWTFDGTNIVFSHADPDDGMRDFLGNKRCADGRSDVVIEVSFSEAMKDAQMSSLDPLGYTPVLQRMTPDQDSLWTAVIPKAKLKTTRERAGRQTIEIFGTDWADNDVRQITTPAAIDPADNSRDGATMRGPGGSDTLHRFAICQALALVVDVTGSMYDEIEAVKEAMTDVIAFNRDDPDRFLLYNIVIFEDTARVRLSTKNADEATIVLQSLQAGFGGACPEASVAALDSLPPLMPAGGLAILATDADPMEGRPRLDATKARLRAKDIEVNTLISGSCESFFDGPLDTDSRDYAAAVRDNGGDQSRASGFPVDDAAPLSELFGTIDARIAFHEVANATGGIYVESFPNSEFVEAARIISRRLGTGSVLVSRSLDLALPGIESQMIAVDETCGELLVLLNFTLGDDTTLRLRRPSGEIVQSTDPDVQVNYAPALACYHIVDPSPGDWTAEVTFANGVGHFELSALVNSPRRLSLGGAPNRRVGTPAPISVTLDGAGTPSDFRLIHPDGTLEQALTLFDDGLHEDGEVGDQTWASTVIVDNEGEFRVAADVVDGDQLFLRETDRTVVVGLPDIATVDTLGFGTVAVGGSTTRVLYVQNVGVVPLIVSGLTSGSSDFVAVPTAFTVKAGDAQRVEVTWTPSDPGAANVIANVASDDPNEPVYDLILAGMAVPPSILTYQPDTLAVAIPQGDSTEVTLRIRNTGLGTSTVVLADPTGPTGPSSLEYRYETGFGPGADVPFRWETLGVGAVTVGPLGLDGAAGPFAIGFEVPFYGITATEFYISENGHITLEGLPALSASVFGPCPPTSYFAPYVAPYLENLDLRHSGRIRWQTDGQRLVVEYQDARRYDLNELDAPLNCQIVLYRDGSIDFNYETVPPDGYPLVAIGSGRTDESVSPSCEILFPARDRTTLHIWRDNPWLEFSAITDSLAGGDSLAVVLRANTAGSGFDVGATYPSTLAVLNDALDTPRREIPVRLTILPGPYSLAGRVTALEDHSGVSGAVVNAVGFYGSHTDTTDSAGDYILTGLSSGDYAITAVSPLFLPAAPESLQVPAETVQNFELTRPIITLDPTSIDATVAAGDSVCVPLVIRNSGTAQLVLDGLRRAESAQGLTGPEYERVLDDPFFDTTGPDLVALDVARSSTQLDFRLVFADTLSMTPPYVFISLDTDRNAGTGAYPPALGYGLPDQNVGAEFELVFDNICGGFITLVDAVTGAYLNGYFLHVEDTVVSFTVPLTDVGNDDGVLNVCVTSLPGICDGGSRRGLGEIPARQAEDALPMEMAGTTFDWMPESGHGTVGSCAWLTVAPDEAVVAPGDSVTLAVCIDASALADTSVGCSVSLQSNDPRRPLAVLPVSVVVGSPVAVPDPVALSVPPPFSLRQNDPNPFRETTRIRFSLPREERVRLTIFDASGRLVQQVLDGQQPAGQHEVVLESGRLSGGIYLYRLEAGGRVSSRKMIVLN